MTAWLSGSTLKEGLVGGIDMTQPQPGKAGGYDPKKGGKFEPGTKATPPPPPQPGRKKD